VRRTVTLIEVGVRLPVCFNRQGIRAFTMTTTFTSILVSSLPTATPNPGPILKVPDGSVDRKHCALLGGLSLIIQAVMGIIVISSLLIKRAYERPKRPWKIWCGDVSKQAIGQAYVHSSNVAISGLISHLSSGRENSCTLYFLNILVDTTFGVLLLYILLKYLSWLLMEQFGFQGLQSGQYGDPPKIKRWAKQLAVYLAALTLMKLAVIGLFAALPSLFRIGDWLLSWLRDNDSQVIFVVLIFPICMNVLQFVSIDSIIKGKTSFHLIGDDEDPPESHMFESDDDGDNALWNNVTSLISSPQIKTRLDQSFEAKSHHYPPPRSTGSSTSSRPNSPIGGPSRSRSPANEPLRSKSPPKCM